MDRRQFVAAAAATGAGAVLPLSSGAASAQPHAQPAREYYDLRKYRCATAPRMKILEDFWSKAMLPACGRAGIGPVGVFKGVYGPDSATLLVLLTHKSLESAATATARLLDDPLVQSAGAEYFAAPIDNPPFVRMDSRLLVAFTGLPNLVVPDATAGNKPRILELRTYESHNERAGRNKIDMINSGEVEYFRRSGAPPVFFGESLFGDGMPSLSYMLVFPDIAARDAGWKAFSKDPDWVKMSAEPRYKDLVSNISDLILRPTAYSQI
jgi:NIPSNAP